jgi:hypothetical protein
MARSSGKEAAARRHKSVGIAADGEIGLVMYPRLINIVLPSTVQPGTIKIRRDAMSVPMKDF